MKPLIHKSLLAAALLATVGLASQTASAQQDPAVQLRAHVGQMEAARTPMLSGKTPRLPSARLHAMVPEHQEMLASFLDECAAMRDGERHDALISAMRRDLSRLPRLHGTALDDFVPGHAARVRELIRLHERLAAS